MHPLRPLSLAPLLGLVLSVPAPAQTSQPVPAEKPTVLTVDAKLVVVPAVVSDKHGLVTTLGKGDFSLTVDGKPQTIRYFDHDNDVPLTVGLLVDVSQSQSAVLDEEQKASQSFLDSMLAPAAPNRPADKAFVLQFGRTAELLQDTTSSRPLLAAGLKQIGTESPGSHDDADRDDRRDDNPSTRDDNTSGGNNGGYGRGRGGSGGNHDRSRGGGTVLYDAVFLSSEDVLPKQTGRRALILLTDGVDRHSKESLNEAIESAQRANTVVYAIYYKGEEHRDSGGPRGGGGGFPGGWPGSSRGGYPGGGGRPGSDGTYPDADGRKVLERMCSETGGRLFQVKGKGSVSEIYKQIGAELRSQYRLGFTPSAESSSDGYHRVELSLTNPDARHDEIRTREGYYTGAPKQK